MEGLREWGAAALGRRADSSDAATYGALFEPYAAGGLSSPRRYLTAHERVRMMRFPAFRRCLSVISDAVSVCPLRVYDVKKNLPVDAPEADAEPAHRGEWCARLLEKRIDPIESNLRLVRKIISELIFDGRAYLLIRGSYVMPTALQLMSSRASYSVLNRTKGNSKRMRTFHLQDDTGQTGTYPDSRVVEISLLDQNEWTSQGIFRGNSPALSVYNAVQIGIAADEYMYRDFSGEALQQQYVLSIPENATPEQEAEYRRQILARTNEQNRGVVVLRNAGPTTDSVDLKPLGGKKPGENRGLNDLLERQSEEVARGMGVPLTLISMKGTQWSGGLRELNRHFLEHTIQHYMKAITAALTDGLLRTTGYEFRFEVPPHQRVDMESIAQVVNQLGGGAQGITYLTRNEVRANLGLPPLDGPEGDEIPKVENTGGRPPENGPDNQNQNQEPDNQEPRGEEDDDDA